MNRKGFHTLRAPALLALLLLAIHPAVAGKRSAATFEPETGAPGAPELRRGAWVEETANHALLLQRLPAEQRLSYFEREAGLAIDPLAARPERDERFLTFLLVLENRGETDLHFNPLRSTLATNRRDFHAPLGLSDLRYEFRTIGAELPPAYERALRVVYDVPVTVEPGRAVSGLLVFRALRPGVKSYRVNVKYAGPDGTEVGFTAPYVRAKSSETARP